MDFYQVAITDFILVGRCHKTNINLGNQHGRNFIHVDKYKYDIFMCIPYGQYRLYLCVYCMVNRIYYMLINQ